MTSISLSLNAYCKKLPEDIPFYTVLSAGLSFTVSMILVGEVRRAIVASSFAATASLISGLATPLFKSLFKRDYLYWYETPVRPICSLAVTQFLLNSLNPRPLYRVDAAPLAFVLSIIDMVTVYLRSKTLSLNDNAIYILI